MKKEHIDKFFPENVWSEVKKDFSDYYRENQIRFNDACNATSSLLKLLLSDSIEPTPKILYRVKNLEECIEKFERKYLADAETKKEGYCIQEKVTDLLGIRVICIYESDIETVANIVRKNFKVLGETDKTEALEIHENQFGYKGLHVDVSLDEV